MDRVQFENLVNQAIRELPAEFRKRLENVVVIVEDRPSEEFLDNMEIPSGDTLFGVYEGTPLTERGFDAPLHPDRIWIFQGPIEKECESEEEIMESRRPSSTRLLTFSVWTTSISRIWDTETSGTDLSTPTTTSKQRGLRATPIAKAMTTCEHWYLR